jgi:hypothetical protein
MTSKYTLASFQHNNHKRSVYFSLHLHIQLLIMKVGTTLFREKRRIIRKIVD